MRPLDGLTVTIVHACVHGKQRLASLKPTNLPVGLLFDFAGANKGEGYVEWSTAFPSPHLRVSA